MADNQQKLTPGWAAILAGHDFDLAYWARSLKAPFEPWVEVTMDSGEPLHVLRSSSWEQLAEAQEVKDRSTALIEQLNGAQSVLDGAQPLTFAGVIRVGSDDTLHRYLFAESASFFMRMGTVATATLVDPNGNPVPPGPPEPSTAQKWIEAGDINDDVADMLTFAARADSWYDIYKAYELAQKLAGGKGRLPKLLGSSAKECEIMRQTANFYRHARAYRPPELTSLADARPLLAFVVRSVLDHTLG